MQSQVIPTGQLSSSIDSPLADSEWQDVQLQGVSRTFALTIPQLPGRLRTAVSNAYLICRALDTIEDEPALSFAEKDYFTAKFLACLSKQENPSNFAQDLHPRLTGSTSPAERILIQDTERLITIYHSLPPEYAAPIFRCATIMSSGMVKHQQPNEQTGLATLHELNNYCYHVAGVVGEMLSDLYAAHNPALDNMGEHFRNQAVSFGQGLQMTNILKDICDDQERGACWLPRDILSAHGCVLDNDGKHHNKQAFEKALGELIAIAHGHLRHALDYTLRIPKSEPGIRNFCLWALGMAVLTLDKIHQNRNFTNSKQVKISRRSVKITIALCKLCVRNDTLLRLLFKTIARNLPLSVVKLPIQR